MIRDLIESLATYTEAKSEHDAARDECDQSWDHFGAHYIENLEKAEAAIEKAFEAAITAKVNAILAAKGGGFWCPICNVRVGPNDVRRLEPPFESVVHLECVSPVERYDGQDEETESRSR